MEGRRLTDEERAVYTAQDYAKPRTHAYDRAYKRGFTTAEFEQVCRDFEVRSHAAFYRRRIPSIEANEALRRQAPFEKMVLAELERLEAELPDIDPRLHVRFLKRKATVAVRRVDEKDLLDCQGAGSQLAFLADRLSQIGLDAAKRL